MNFDPGIYCCEWGMFVAFDFFAHSLTSCLNALYSHLLLEKGRILVLIWKKSYCGSGHLKKKWKLCCSIDLKKFPTLNRKKIMIIKVGTFQGEDYFKDRVKHKQCIHTHTHIYINHLCEVYHQMCFCSGVL